MEGLVRYPASVLVAGCQRSGTTMLARLIAGSAGFSRYRFTADDELDAALILAGLICVPTDRRYCFQSTYLNERYREYGEIRSDQKLIWVVRNPFSVVWSMVHNWSGWALSELYLACAEIPPADPRMQRAWMPWPFGPSRIEKACYSYVGKITQIIEIQRLVPSDQLLIVDYDQLVDQPLKRLKTIFDFIGEPFNPAYSTLIRKDSIEKAARLSTRARRFIEMSTMPAYERCRQLLAGT